MPGIARWLGVLMLLLGAPRPSLCASMSHTSNWAVLVDASRYWFNYRHAANTLSMYRTVRRLGVPDSNIILMLGDDLACDARNGHPGRVFNNADHSVDLYGDSVEVDYRGYEVTVENFMRVLTGRHDPAVPRSKRLLSDQGSNVLVYITGHGGNEFLKFQDNEELMAQDLADAVAQMHEKGRYREMLFIADTCQASTLFSRFDSPNILTMASSKKDESSYSHHNDRDVGVSVIDRFTYHTLEFLEQVDMRSSVTLQNLFGIYRQDLLRSTFTYQSALFSRPLNRVKVTEFLGSVTVTEPTQEVYPLSNKERLLSSPRLTSAQVPPQN
ncbi:unnamed protein product [Ostreobium quekettii]|uniref:GPI-anchor transamidase n=1 Tax=Ostreobium quekettii TaxID=121088 RepID=A0A8S1J2Z6_9CHLO|nr:unnamed protein product [Ostreobium quekettii]|eukprot:evm.model.scf_815EXC.6 EVM.evm.TU.scf_815EXC.6   scf_815EXC:25915-29514(-)